MKLSDIKVNNFKDPGVLLSAILNFSLLILILYPLLQPQLAHAAVTEGFVRFDRLSTGTTPVTGTACLKSDQTTQGKVQIRFPSDWTISGTPSNWTITTTNLPTDPVGGGAGEAWPGIGTANAVTGNIVTFPGTAFIAGHFYCFNFSGASSTVGAAGDNKLGELKTEGGAPFTDFLAYATSVITAGGEQITVNASVSATMSFTLSATSVALGTLSTSTTAQGAPTITETVSTNARNGWTSWVKSGTGTLHSTNASADITSPGSYNGTVEDLTSQPGYVLAAASGSGSPTVNAEWIDGSDVNKGGHLSTTFTQVATKTTPASSDTVVYTARAKISATQQAASDYTDTLTITAAGSF